MLNSEWEKNFRLSYKCKSAPLHRIYITLRQDDRHMYIAYHEWGTVDDDASSSESLAYDAELLLLSESDEQHEGDDADGEAELSAADSVDIGSPAAMAAADVDEVSEAAVRDDALMMEFVVDLSLSVFGVEEGAEGFEMWRDSTEEVWMVMAEAEDDVVSIVTDLQAIKQCKTNVKN